MPSINQMLWSFDEINHKKQFTHFVPKAAWHTAVLYNAMMYEEVHREINPYRPEFIL